MPIECVLLRNAPHTVKKCKHCGAENPDFLRGQIQSSWRRFFGASLRASDGCATMKGTTMDKLKCDITIRRDERRKRIALLREELAALIREDREDALGEKGDLLTRCRELIAANQKVAAVRLYREETGSTLMEAAHALGILIPK